MSNPLGTRRTGDEYQLCSTCLQRRADGRCRIGHKKPPCREYLRDRRKRGRTVRVVEPGPEEVGR